MQKVTLSLPDSSNAIARDRASSCGMTVSAWVDRAIRNLAAAEDAAAYDAWREGWSEEDKANEAALDRADRAALESGPA